MNLERPMEWSLEIPRGYELIKKGTIMDLFNIICGVCSIVGLLVSVFTAGKVIKISQTINCGNKDERSKNSTKISGSTIYGDFVGRDSISGTGNSK